VNYLPAKLYRWVRLLGLILTFVFMLEMNRAAYKMVAYALAMKMRSSTWMMFPLFWPQLTILVGFVLLTLVLVVDIWRTAGQLRTGKQTAEGLSR
jgi:TRAP-type C4-dicarboxylate transport system permease small subunit